MADLALDQVDEYDFHLAQCYETSKRWSRGKHKTQDGKIIAIKDMETSHIQNCINLWKNNPDLDIKPFEKELKKRTAPTKTVEHD